MKSKTIALLVLAVGVAAVQFVPIDRDNPPVTADLQAPDEIKAMLTRSCYDCHSNETVWPWYSYVAPVSFQLNTHIKTGREHLNFSNWGEYDKDEQEELAAALINEVSEGTMPKFPYALAHPAAKLNEEQKTQLTDWFTVTFALSNEESEVN